MIPRLFVAEHLQKGARFQADERAAHYLMNVLRRGSDDPVLLFNGRDGEYRGRIAEAQKRRLVLEATALTRAQEAEPDLWLCFAPLKKDAVDFLVEKGTELGVARFQPVLTAHTASNRITRAASPWSRPQPPNNPSGCPCPKCWSRSAWNPCAPAGRRTGTC